MKSSDPARYLNTIPRDGRGKVIQNPVMSKLKPGSNFRNWEAEDYGTYQGQIPSIVGLVIMLVNYKSIETTVFAREDNAFAISKKYGSGFKRFLGFVKSDYHVKPKPRVSFNCWDAVVMSNDFTDEDPTEEDKIVSYELSKAQLENFEEVSDEDYNPYSDRHENIDDEESLVKIDSPEHQEQIIWNATEGIKTAVSERLSEIEGKVFDLWKRGYPPREICGRLSMTENDVKNAKLRIYSKLHREYRAKSRTEFSKIIDTIGENYKKEKYRIEIQKIRNSGSADKDSTIFSRLSEREHTILSLMIKSYSSSKIAQSLSITSMGVSQHKKRIIQKIGSELFDKVVSGIIKVDPKSATASPSRAFNQPARTVSNVDSRPGLSLEEPVNSFDNTEIHQDPLYFSSPNSRLSSKMVHHEKEVPSESKRPYWADIIAEVKKTDIIPSEQLPINNSSAVDSLLSSYLSGEIDKLPPQFAELENESVEYIEEVINHRDSEYQCPSPTSAPIIEIPFSTFLSAYGLNKDAQKAEALFHSLSDADKQLALEYIPSYVKTLSNPAFKKSPVAYLTSEIWKAKMK